MKLRTIAGTLWLAATFLAAAGCLRPPVTGTAGLEERMRTELYFGLSMPDGEVVSEDEWQAFVDEQIMPRFKDGLTILDARGQYLDEGEALIKERTKVVVIIHPDTPRARIEIYNIIQAYKRRYGQGAVLRVTDEVGASL